MTRTINKYKFLLVIVLSVASRAFADISTYEVHSVSDIPAERPDAGSYRLHMIDVGTGLSVLAQGNDWDLLFDAGSQDDNAGNRQSGTRSRVVAYLTQAIGRSGGRRCTPEGDNWAGDNPSAQLQIEHVFQSHPHQDHGVMLDDVLDCYQVNNFWDSGAMNETAFYERILERVATETGMTYHTALGASADRTISIRNSEIEIPQDVSWYEFSELDEVVLDDNASFTILHANGQQHSDPNENSIVIRLDLGKHSVLLTGDAESGPRESPSAELGDVEEYLVDHYAALLDVDVLQVGHHGSKTSTRSKFVETVSPDIALVSSGPYRYGSVTLPDEEIIYYLASEGIDVLRTDHFDDGCPASDRVGREDNELGGCSNYILFIDND